MKDIYHTITDITGKTICVFCWSDNAMDEAFKLKERGMNVVIGMRDGEFKDNDLWESYRRNGFEVFGLWKAVEQADIIQVW